MGGHNNASRALLGAAIVLTSCTPTAPTTFGAGVSSELAARRRAQIADVRYHLALDVTHRDTALGRVDLAFVRRQGGEVVLDFRGTALAGGVVNGVGLDTIEYDGAHIRLPDAVLREGRNTVRFDFATPIAPSGASIIRFHDVQALEDYLYTLLVPADANQLFPCFDQPDLKARVTLTLTTPRGWSALANGRLRDTLASGATPSRAPSSIPPTASPALTWRFTETEPISTYLIAFAAGPWARITRTVEGRPMTMYVRASRATEAEADALIAANARAVTWLEDYFGVPFPFQKLDFVLAPALPFGGMEHPGAIFYNEDRFIFRERPTESQRLGRDETIYHEIAHQWFGDLVTMEWFDDLWLKEGFATYTAAKMQAALGGSSADVWKRFFLRHKPSAYAVDGSKGTVAVWQPLDNLDQAKSNYGPIVYDKAPGILKQLEYLVGDSAFRAGVHAFLTRHAYANATWRDLLDAVGAAAGRALDGWGEAYLRRSGMPVLEQYPVVERGRLTGIMLRQRPARPRAGAGAWPLRTELVVGGLAETPLTMPVEMTGESLSIALPTPRSLPALVFANAGDRAYAVVLPDTGSTRWLLAHVGAIEDPLLRAMGWASLWDLVRDAELAPVDYLAAVIRAFPAEQDEQIVASVLGHAQRAGMAYLTPVAQDTMVPALTAALRRVVEGAGRSYGIRKTALRAMIAVASAGESVRYLETLLDRPLPGLSIGPPVRWAIVTKLIELGVPHADQRLAVEMRRDTTTDGRRRAFVAGAARPTAATKRAYFERYLTDATLNEDWASSSLPAFNGLGVDELTRPYLRPALDTLPWIQRNRRIFFLGSWLDAFFHGQVSEEALRIGEQFVRESPKLPPDLRRKVLQAMDELERTVVIRRVFGRAAPPAR